MTARDHTPLGWSECGPADDYGPSDGQEGEVSGAGGRAAMAGAGTVARGVGWGHGGRQKAAGNAQRRRILRVFSGPATALADASAGWHE